MHNVLRDFQKNKNYKNRPFSRPVFHQIQLDMANKKHATTISMEKWRKCTSQIFDFGNFVTEILCKHIERFSKCKKLWKLAILFAILLPEIVSYGRQIIYHDYKHGQVKKMYISEFSFLKICHRDFCQTYWEIFKKQKNRKIGHTLCHFTTRNCIIWQTNYIPWLYAWTS